MLPDFFSYWEKRRYCFLSASIPTAVILSTAATAAGAAISAVGAIEQGQAAKKAGEANAQIAANNAQIAKQNATLAGQAGEQQAAMSEMKTRALVGSIKANEAASNIDVNSGSVVDVRSSAAELGELDAINIRGNAARTAYGYQNQALSFQGQSSVDQFAGQNAATAGFASAGGTLLGGAGSATTNWLKFQNQGGFNAGAE